MNFANNFLFLFSIKKEKEYGGFEKPEGTLKSETLQNLKTLLYSGFVFLIHFASYKKAVDTFVFIRIPNGNCKKIRHRNYF